MKQEEMQVVDKLDNQVATLETFAGLMDESASDSRDIILPKILLMQGLSHLVADAKAVMGEMRGSLDNNLLGNKDSALEVIPFYSNKSWILFEEKSGKLEYTGQVPFGPDNANWTWDAVIDGKKVRRDQSINVYCVLPSEIESGVFLPYLITFRRTSYTAGKKIVTLKEKLRMFKRPLASTTLVISCKQEKNEKGAYYVWDCRQGRDTTQIEMQALTPWFTLVSANASTIKVDDSDLEKEASAAPVAYDAEDMDY